MESTKKRMRIKAKPPQKKITYKKTFKADFFLQNHF